MLECLTHLGNARVINIYLMTFNVVHSFHFIEFLDVSFRSLNFELDTDVFYKPTDAHRYLNFNSAHPPTRFQGYLVNFSGSVGL